MEDSSSVDNFECQCKDVFRSVCKGLPYYADAEGKRYCVLHYPRDAKEESDNQFQEALDRKYRDQDFDFSGVYFPSVPYDFKGFAFTEITSFLGATFSKEANFSGATFTEEADFSGATFTEKADFSGVTFGARVDFVDAIFDKRATFSRATFNKLANFAVAIFSEVDFRGASFSKMANFYKTVFYEEADLSATTFSEEADLSATTFYEDVYFSAATFSEWADFSAATFSEKAVFSEAIFSKLVVFSEAIFSKWASFFETFFKERALFWRLKVFPETTLIFTNAITEKPERISFHTTYLRPSWFIDVDAQKFDFSAVEWFRIPNESEPDEDKLEKQKSEDEIEKIEALELLDRFEYTVLFWRSQESGVLHSERAYEEKTPQALRKLRKQSLRKLAKSCNRLMLNAEENRDYPTANEFHYWSMEAQRKEGWSRLGLIATLYWALSGYGERPLRAFWVLVAVYAVFAVLYMLLPSSPFSVLSTSDVCEYLGCLGQAATYSLSALARLLPADPELSPGLFQFLVTVEGILGPLQIALFLLAVRRKVMR